MAGFFEAWSPLRHSFFLHTLLFLHNTSPDANPAQGQGMSPVLDPAPATAAKIAEMSEEEQMAMAINASIQGGPPPGFDLGAPADADASYDQSEGMFGIDEELLVPPEPTPEQIAQQKKAESDAAFQARQNAWESQVFSLFSNLTESKLKKKNLIT